MPVRMLGLVVNLALADCLGRLVVVDQVKRQLDHLQPLLALVGREVVAGRGQMLKQRINDRVERGSVDGVQLGLVWFLGYRRLLWMTVRGAGVGGPYDVPSRLFQREPKKPCTCVPGAHGQPVSPDRRVTGLGGKADRRMSVSSSSMLDSTSTTSASSSSNSGLSGLDMLVSRVNNGLRRFRHGGP